MGIEVLGAAIIAALPAAATAGMTAFAVGMMAIQAAITIASIAYQRSRAAKLKSQAEAEADKQKGFRLVGEGESQPISLFYGRNLVGGARVYHKVQGNYVYAAGPTPGGNPRGDIFLSQGDSRGLDNRNPTNTIIRYKAELITYPTDGTDPTRITYENAFLNAPANVYSTYMSFYTGILPDQVQAALVLAPGNSISLTHYPLDKSAEGNNQNNEVTNSYTIGTYNAATGYMTVVLDYASYATGTPAMSYSMFSNSQEMLIVQQVVCFGGIEAIYGIDVDRKDWRDKSFNGDWADGAVRMHAYYDGNYADAMAVATAGEDRSTAVFTDTAYLSCIFKLCRNDPQFSGVPSLQSYLEGKRVKPVTKIGDSYSYNGTATYSNNPALCLLDYLTDTKYGKSLDPNNEIDLKSFYDAAVICDTLVPVGASPSYSVTKEGRIWESRGGERNIKLYECNLGIDLTRPIRDNIEVLLETMGKAELVWSGGKYKLQLLYPLVWGVNFSSTYSGKKAISLTSGSYTTGDIAQYEWIYDDAGTQRQNIGLFRSLISNNTWEPINTLNNTPNDSVWADDVLAAKLTDDDIIRGEIVTQSWPNSQTRYNYCTIKFLNESMDFAEDSVSWPNKKDPKIYDQYGNAGSTHNLYDVFLAEDNGVPLETESFQSGDTTMWHALATAEEHVRASRSSIVYNFAVPVRYTYLEPGDIIKVYSKVLNIYNELMQVEEVKVNDNSQANIQAVRYDARHLAWNARDDEYIANRSIFNYELPQASNLYFFQKSVDVVGSLTSGLLIWEAPDDVRVTFYRVLICNLPPTEAANANTVWQELGTTSGTRWEIQDLKTDFYTVTVVACSESGMAPRYSVRTGSHWPYLDLGLIKSGLPFQSAMISFFKRSATIPAKPAPQGTWDFKLLQMASGEAGMNALGWYMDRNTPLGDDPLYITQGYARANFGTDISGTLIWSDPVPFLGSGGGIAIMPSPSQMFIKASDLATAFEPEYIFLKVLITGTVTDPLWHYSDDSGETWSAWPGATQFEGLQIAVNRTDIPEPANKRVFRFSCTFEGQPEEDQITLYKLVAGSSAFTVRSDNEFFNVQCNSDGDVLSYNGCGTVIHASIGIVDLTYKKYEDLSSNVNNLLPGEFTVTAARDADTTTFGPITIPANSNSGGTAAYYQFSAGMEDNSTRPSRVKFTVTARGLKTGDALVTGYSYFTAARNIAGLDAQQVELYTSPATILKDGAGAFTTPLHADSKKTVVTTVTSYTGYLRLYYSDNGTVFNLLTTINDNDTDFDLNSWPAAVNAKSFKVELYDNTNTVLLATDIVAVAEIGQYVLDLSDDVIAVTCIADGTPTAGAVASTNTVLSVLRDNVVQAGWSFSKTDPAGQTSTLTPSGNISTYQMTAFTATDFVDYVFTATKSGETNLTANFSVIKVKAGAAGTAGANAKYVIVNATNQVFTKTDANATATPASVNIVATKFGGLAGTQIWQKWNGATWDDLTAAYTGYNTTTLTVTSAQAGTLGTYRIKVTDTAIDYYDEVSLVTVTGGSDALTVSSSNATHSFTADVNGNVSVYTGSGTTFTVYRGATALSYSASGTAGQYTWSLAKSTETYITGNVGSNGVTGVASNFNAAQNNASILWVISVRYDTNAPFATINSLQTFSKAKQGAQGNTGATGTGLPGHYQRVCFKRSATPLTSDLGTIGGGATVYPSGWSANDPGGTDTLYQCFGDYDPDTGNTDWGVPYVASLRVNELSAITAAMGSLTSGEIKMGTLSGTNLTSGGNGTYIAAGIFKIGRTDGKFFKLESGTITSNLDWENLDDNAATEGSTVGGTGSGNYASVDNKGYGPTVAMAAVWGTIAGGAESRNVTITLYGGGSNIASFTITVPCIQQTVFYGGEGGYIETTYVGNAWSASIGGSVGASSGYKNFYVAVSGADSSDAIVTAMALRR
jgi:hypothetical protein